MKIPKFKVRNCPKCGDCKIEREYLECVECVKHSCFCTYYWYTRPRDYEEKK